MQMEIQICIILKYNILKYNLLNKEIYERFDNEKLYKIR